MLQDVYKRQALDLSVSCPIRSILTLAIISRSLTPVSYTHLDVYKRQVDPKVKALLKTTKESLYLGIQHAIEGKRLGDISHAVQFYCESKGYSVVRELVGHGIGRKMHEEPEVPNYGRPGCGPLLRSGMCICIEPMINMGSKNVVFEKDGWTVRTKDRKCSAHFEHCIAIRPEGPQILSSFEFLEEVLGNNAI